MKLFYRLLLELLFFPRFLANVLFGARLQKAALVELFENAETLGFDYHVLELDTRRLWLYGDFSGVVVCVDNTDSQLSIRIRINMGPEGLSSASAETQQRAEEQLAAFRRRWLRFFGSVSFEGDSLVAKWDGFLDDHPYIDPTRLRGMVDDLAKIVGSMSNTLESAMDPAQWQREQLFEDVHYGKIHRLRFALERGADPNIVADGGNYLLHEAFAYSSAEAVELEILRALLDAGAQVDVADANGDTPLMIAAFEERAAAVELLLERGADAHAVNKDEKNALSFARPNGEVAEILVAAGAK